MTIDKQINILWEAIHKQGKYIEELEKDNATLKKVAHPPVFTSRQYDNIIGRLEYLEAFINNLTLIQKGDEN